MYHIFYNILSAFTYTCACACVRIHTYIRVNAATFNETIRFNSITHRKIRPMQQFPRYTSALFRVASHRVASIQFRQFVSALTNVSTTMCRFNTVVVSFLPSFTITSSLYIFITLQNYIHQSLFIYISITRFQMW